jgi:DNA-binding transcriptional LysR family regulator
MHNRWIIEDAFAKAGCVVEPQVQSNSILTLYSHVRMGNWATIAPSFHAQLTGIPDGVRALTLTTPEIQSPVGLIWRNTSPLSPIIKAFLSVTDNIGPIA